jgi:hypothetical protein
VQGCESQVLAGAVLALESMAAIEVELPLQRLYDRQTSMADMLDTFDRLGFNAVTIMTERFHSGWLGAVDVDAIFIRKEFSPLQQTNGNEGPPSWRNVGADAT